MILGFPWHRLGIGRQSGPPQPPDAGATGPQHAELAQLLDYWEGLRGPGGRLPLCDSLDPPALNTLLGSCLLGERVGLGLVRLRWAGERLNQEAALDLKGLPFSLLFDPEERPRLALAMAGLFDRPATVELHLTGGGAAGRLLLLPMLGQRGRCDMVLGCLSAGTGPGQPLPVPTGRGGSHRHWSIARMVTRRLELSVEAMPLLFRELPPPKPPQALPSVRRAGTKPSPVPYLRLVHSAPRAEAQ